MSTPKRGLLLLGILAMIETSSIRAAETYRFRWDETGPLPQPASGRVSIDGKSYRVDYFAASDGEPRASDVTVKAATDSVETYLNTALRTYFRSAEPALKSASASNLPYPTFLSPLRGGGATTVKLRQFDCPAPSEASARDGTKERTVRLSIDYGVTEPMFGGGSLRTSFSLSGTYVSVPASDLPRPRQFVPVVRTGDSELDLRIATCLALVVGLPRSHELRIRREVEGGVTDEYEQTLRLDDHQVVPGIEASRFQVPAGYRYKEPEFAGPGS